VVVQPPASWTHALSTPCTTIQTHQLPVAWCLLTQHLQLLAQFPVDNAAKRSLAHNMLSSETKWHSTFCPYNSHSILHWSCSVLKIDSKTRYQSLDCLQPLKCSYSFLSANLTTALWANDFLTPDYETEKYCTRMKGALCASRFKSLEHQRSNVKYWKLWQITKYWIN
jgi:hypothetical protein